MNNYTEDPTRHPITITPEIAVALIPLAKSEVNLWLLLAQSFQGEWFFRSPLFTDWIVNSLDIHYTTVDNCWYSLLRQGILEKQLNDDPNRLKSLYSRRYDPRYSRTRYRVRDLACQDD